MPKKSTARGKYLYSSNKYLTITFRNTLMTERYLKQLCKEQKLYQTPELNDIIYLHFKGNVSLYGWVQRV